MKEPYVFGFFGLALICIVLVISSEQELLSVIVNFTLCVLNPLPISLYVTDGEYDVEAVLFH